MGSDDKEGEEKWTEQKKRRERTEERIEGKEVQSRPKRSERVMPLIWSSERFFSLTHSAGGL